MTPDEARDLLDGTTPGPWEWREGKDQNGEFVALSGPDGADALRTWDGDLYASGVEGTNTDKALAAAAPALAAMRAEMTAEYRHEVQSTTDRTWQPLTEWDEGEPDRRPWDVAPTRIVRRYVTTPEVIE